MTWYLALHSRLVGTSGEVCPRQSHSRFPAWACSRPVTLQPRDYLVPMPQESYEGEKWPYRPGCASAGGRSGLEKEVAWGHRSDTAWTRVQMSTAQPGALSTVPACLSLIKLSATGRVFFMFV